MKLKFTELEPEFLKIESENSFKRGCGIGEADGVLFLCPGCFLKNQGKPPIHSMICWQPHVPQTVNPIDGRWKFYGTSFEDLTFDNGIDPETQKPKASSVWEKNGCGAHFHISYGMVEMIY
jgi:hypothetical protein